MPINQFLGTFESTYIQVVGDSPFSADYNTVKGYLQPLMIGVAYSELRDINITSYSELSNALIQRFGKTEDEVVTQLLSLRQGSLSISTYIDKVQELCSHA